MTIAGVKKLMRDGELPKNIDDFLAASAVDTDTAAIMMPVTKTKVSSDEIKFAIDLLSSARDLLQ